MLIALKDVPHDERHLLFCSELASRRGTRHRRHRRNRKTYAQPTVESTPIDNLSVIAIAAGFDAAGTLVGVA